MERTVATLAAFLPFTTALSSESGAGISPDDELSRLRHKKGGLEDDASSEENSGNRADGDEGPSRASDPSHEQLSDSGASQVGIGDLAQGAVGGPAPMSQGNDGMFTPAPGQPTMGAPPSAGSGGGSGGGGVSSRIKTGFVTEKADDDLDLDNDGYLEPNPTDADAMLILLGGMADGAGAGATTSGEVVFDIVDYGPITVGYGYASYAAYGSENAIADTFVDVTGADLVFSYDFHNTDWNMDQSYTYVIAVDIEEDAFSEHTEFEDFDWNEVFAQGPFQQWLVEEEAEVSFEGDNHALVSMTGEVVDPDNPMLTVDTGFYAFDNIGSAVTNWAQSEQANLSMMVKADGVETLVSADSSLLEIDDHYSSVSSAVVVIA